MAEFHAAVVHPGDDVPDTYCGVVSQEYVDAVVAACADHPDRWVKPGRGGGVYVLREDGDLDHYQPVEGVPR